MEISGIITAIIFGTIIGALGRLVLPGRQNIGWLWTIGVGIAAALVGTASPRHWASPTPRASTGSNGPSRSASPPSA